MTWVSVVIGLLGLMVAGLGEFGWIELRHVKELKAQRDVAIAERDRAWEMVREYQQDGRKLVGRVSQLSNTLARAVPAGDDGRPVKAKSAAEVRQAVERRNLLEMEKADD